MKTWKRSYKCRKCGGTTYKIQGGSRRCIACWPAYQKDWEERHWDQHLRSSRKSYEKRKKVREAQMLGAGAAFNLSRNPHIDEEHRNKRIEEMKAGKVTRNDLKEICNRDAGRCVYCRAKVLNIDFYAKDPRGFDHFIPLLHGGTHEPWNLGVCCTKCNYDKGQRTLLEYDHDKGFPSDHFKQIPAKAFGLDMILLDDDD
jgi:5-methylcytosine-specific restriction endonuclease McrA